MTEMDLDKIIDSFSARMEQRTEFATPQQPTMAEEPMAKIPFQIGNADFVVAAGETIAEMEAKNDLGAGTFEEDIIDFSSAPEVAFVEEATITPEELPAGSDAQLIEEISRIPDKMAFKIGEVADITGIKQYVLRYWETEFEVLKPKKSRQNQRMYTRKEIEHVLMIKKLLYRDKFSIEGARKAMKSLKAQVRETKNWDQVADRFEQAIDLLRDLKAEIQATKTHLCG